MSPAGIGNAAVGLLAGHAVKSIFTAPDNQPATKGDIKALLNRMERYHKVGNLPLGINGSLPYFDLDTKEIVYFKNPMLSKLGN